MSEGLERCIVTTDPRTIWPLNEPDRLHTVQGLVNMCALRFIDAEKSGAIDDARGAVASAVTTFRGIFPDQGAPAHILLSALTEMLTDASAGKRQHILLQPGRKIPGTRKGMRHVELAAFAISAVWIVLSWDLAANQSDAQTRVAEMLAERKCSLKINYKNDDNQNMPTPITAQAIEDWMDDPERHAIFHDMAAGMMEIHTQNLINRGAEEAHEVWQYLCEKASEIADRYNRRLA